MIPRPIVEIDFANMQPNPALIYADILEEFYGLCSEIYGLYLGSKLYFVESVLTNKYVEILCDNYPLALGVLGLSSIMAAIGWRKRANVKQMILSFLSSISKNLKIIFLVPTTYKLFNHWYPLIFVLGGGLSAFIIRSPRILAYIAANLSSDIFPFIYLGAFLYMIFLFYFIAHKLWFIPKLYCDFKKYYSEGNVSFFSIMLHCFFNIFYTMLSLFIAYCIFEALNLYYEWDSLILDFLRSYQGPNGVNLCTFTEGFNTLISPSFAPPLSGPDPLTPIPLAPYGRAGGGGGGASAARASFWPLSLNNLAALFNSKYQPSVLFLESQGLTPIPLPSRKGWLESCALLAEGREIHRWAAEKVVTGVWGCDPDGSFNLKAFIFLFLICQILIIGTLQFYKVKLETGLNLGKLSSASGYLAVYLICVRHGGILIGLLFEHQLFLVNGLLFQNNLSGADGDSESLGNRDLFLNDRELSAASEPSNSRSTNSQNPHPRISASPLESHSGPTHLGAGRVGLQPSAHSGHHYPLGTGVDTGGSSGSSVSPSQTQVTHGTSDPIVQESTPHGRFWGRYGKGRNVEGEIIDGGHDSASGSGDAVTASPNQDPSGLRRREVEASPLEADSRGRSTSRGGNNERGHTAKKGIVKEVRTAYGERRLSPTRGSSPDLYPNIAGNPVGDSQPSRSTSPRGGAPAANNPSLGANRSEFMTPAQSIAVLAERHKEFYSNRYASNPFPYVMGQIQEELTKYHQESSTNLSGKRSSPVVSSKRYKKLDVIIDAFTSEQKLATYKAAAERIQKTVPLPLLVVDSEAENGAGPSGYKGRRGYERSSVTKQGTQRVTPYPTPEKSTSNPYEHRRRTGHEVGGPYNKNLRALPHSDHSQAAPQWEPGSVQPRQGGEEQRQRAASVQYPQGANEIGLPSPLINQPRNGGVRPADPQELNVRPTRFESGDFMEVDPEGVRDNGRGSSHWDNNYENIHGGGVNTPAVLISEAAPSHTPTHVDHGTSDGATGYKSQTETLPNASGASLRREQEGATVTQHPTHSDDSLPAADSQPLSQSGPQVAQGYVPNNGQQAPANVMTANNPQYPRPQIHPAHSLPSQPAANNTPLTATVLPVVQAHVPNIVPSPTAEFMKKHYPHIPWRPFNNTYSKPSYLADNNPPLTAALPKVGQAYGPYSGQATPANGLMANLPRILWPQSQPVRSQTHYPDAYYPPVRSTGPQVAQGDATANNNMAPANVMQQSGPSSLGTNLRGEEGTPALNQFTAPHHHSYQVGQSQMPAISHPQSLTYTPTAVNTSSHFSETGPLVRNVLGVGREGAAGPVEVVPGEESRNRAIQKNYNTGEVLQPTAFSGGGEGSVAEPGKRIEYSALTDNFVPQKIKPVGTAGLGD
jgi:hypothetical protein